MSSLPPNSILSSSPPALNRKGPYLLLQDDAPPQLSARGQGTLGHLIRNRSHGSIARYGSTWRGQGNGGASDNTPDLEAGLPDTMAPPSHVHSVHTDYAESPRRPPSEERRLSAVLNSAGVRSMRLIGSSNPRYRWPRYWKTEEQLSSMKKPIREYYERTNYLIQQYLYIDKLLDSSLPHDLLNEYNNLPASHFRGVEVPDTICEEPNSSAVSRTASRGGPEGSVGGGSKAASGVGTPLLSDGSNGRSENGDLAVSKKVKRTPKDIYRATETTPLFTEDDDNWDEEGLGPKPEIPWLEEEEDVDSGASIVTLAIYVNFAANFLLLAGKIIVIVSVPSMSVLASLVDAVLDFLSTSIVWPTTWLISRQDQYQYPVGRRRLEPLGVLVFSVIMITSFAQVALESGQKLLSTEREVIQLGTPAIVIMASTVFVKGLCWLWCRLIKNSSVQALADDAVTDVIFNTGSIFFPIGKYSSNPRTFGKAVADLVASGLFLPHLVDGCSGWSAPVPRRHVQLVPDVAAAHQEPVGLQRHGGSAQRPALSHHALRQHHPPDPGLAGLPCRRQAQCRS